MTRDEIIKSLKTLLFKKYPNLRYRLLYIGKKDFSSFPVRIEIKFSFEGLHFFYQRPLNLNRFLMGGEEADDEFLEFGIIKPSIDEIYNFIFNYLRGKA